MKFSLKPLLLAACMTAGLTATGLAQASLGAWVQDKALGLEQYRAGLTTSMVTVDGHDIKVFTRHLDSAEPCIVMIHGFTARGAHWFRMAQKMPDDRCVIALDLPDAPDAQARLDKIGQGVRYIGCDLGKLEELEVMAKALPWSIMLIGITQVLAAIGKGAMARFASMRDVATLLGELILATLALLTGRARFDRADTWAVVCGRTTSIGGWR